MNKKLLLLLFVLVIISGCESQTKHPGSDWYIYKYSDSIYYDYVAGIANDRTGEYKLITFPINFNEERLDNGFIFNRGGYNKNSIVNDWVLLDLKKEILNQSLGYAGCSELQKQTYPDCYGEGNYRPGQNIDCDSIFEQERRSETSICLSINGTPDILYTDVFEEFYFCQFLPLDTSHSCLQEIVVQLNEIIDSNGLGEYCIKLK